MKNSMFLAYWVGNITTINKNASIQERIDEAEDPSQTLD
jgi:hypothetical protein